MSLLTTIRARWYAHRLDDAIIEGARRDSSPELALRARRLTDAAFRADLATSSEATVAVPHTGRFLVLGLVAFALLYAVVWGLDHV